MLVHILLQAETVKHERTLTHTYIHSFRLPADFGRTVKGQRVRISLNSCCVLQVSTVSWWCLRLGPFGNHLRELERGCCNNNISG